MSNEKMHHSSVASYSKPMTMSNISLHGSLPIISAAPSNSKPPSSVNLQKISIVASHQSRSKSKPQSKPQSNISVQKDASVSDHTSEPEPPPPKEYKCGPPPEERGLKPLIKEISREVLRHQPSDLYEFIALYLAEKVHDREMKKLEVLYPPEEERQGSWEGQSGPSLSYAELLNFLNDINVDLDMAQHAALVIQAHFRGFLGRLKYKDMKQEYERMDYIWHLWLEPGDLVVDEQEDLEFVIGHYELTLDEANAFATKIQSFFRGQFQRERFAHLNPDLAEHLRQLRVTHSDANLKATVIQALFRGYLARKELKHEKLEEQEHRISVLRGHSLIPPPSEEVENFYDSTSTIETEEFEESEEQETNDELTVSSHSHELEIELDE